VAERKNQTTVSVARAMIHDQGLQMYLWAEAYGTTVYVQNRSPQWRLGDITLEEAFTREKPNISHLRMFGCPVYIHVPQEKRTKLEPAKKQGIFVGYSESVKANGSTYLTSGRWSLAEMLHSRRRWLIGDRDVQIGIVMIHRREWSPPLL
jgi:hypothetical protein